MSEQRVTIAPRATSFTAVCPICAAERPDTAWAGVTFAGRLDLDLDAGTFLCRRGHSIRVERTRPSRPAASEAA